MAKINRKSTLGHPQGGATAIEYGLLATVAAVAVIVGIGTFGDQIGQFFNKSAEPATEAAELTVEPDGLELVCMVNEEQARRIFAQVARQGSGELGIYVNGITGACTTGKPGLQR